MRSRPTSVRRKAKNGKGKRSATGAPWGARIPARRVLDDLRMRLAAAAYNEASIAARLGVAHPVAISLERYPIYATRLERRDPLDVAIDLFLLQGEVPPAEVEALLGASLIRALTKAGILEAAGRGRRAPLGAAVSLYPCAGAIFATDHRWRPSPRLARTAPAAPVMYLGGDSYALAYLAPRRPLERVLDLCTGSGVHAILAAHHADRVVAVDVEPRALAFVRFNAALNGVSEKIELARGDLYGPLAPGERYDLILANPPFVPSPHTGRARVAFRDAGATGEDVLARIVAGLPARLERDGMAAIVSVFAEMQGESYGAKLERWLPRGTDAGALLLRLGADAPAEYALSQTRRAFGDGFAEHAARHARWLETIRRARIRRLLGGVLVVRLRSGAPAPPWWRAVDAAWPTQAYPEALESAWRTCELARTIVFPDEVLDRSARLPADIRITDELERDGDAGVRARSHRLRAASAFLGAEVGVSSELRALIAYCDGSRSLRAALEALAPDLHTTARELGDRIVPDLIELIARGLLVLDKM